MKSLQVRILFDLFNGFPIAGAQAFLDDQAPSAMRAGTAGRPLIHFLA